MDETNEQHVTWVNKALHDKPSLTLVYVYVDLLVFTRIAGTL